MDILIFATVIAVAAAMAVDNIAHVIVAAVAFALVDVVLAAAFACEEMTKMIYSNQYCG